MRIRLLSRKLRIQLMVMVAFGVMIASVFGSASAARADYVSPEAFESEGSHGWKAFIQTAAGTIPEFDECSVIFPDGGGMLGYGYHPENTFSGVDEISNFLNHFFVNLSEGEGFFGLLIDILDDTGEVNNGDIVLEISSGITAMNSDSIATLGTGIGLDLPDNATIGDFLEAVGDTNLNLQISAFYFSTETTAELDWFEVGDERYWFGTDPLCGAKVSQPDPTVDDEEEPDETDGNSPTIDDVVEPDPVVLKPNEVSFDQPTEQKETLADTGFSSSSLTIMGSAALLAAATIFAFRRKSFN